MVISLKRDIPIAFSFCSFCCIFLIISTGFHSSWSPGNILRYCCNHSESLGSSMAPVVLGRIYDKSHIEITFLILPFVLILLGAVLFYLGSRCYDSDMIKVAKIKLEDAV